MKKNAVKIFLTCLFVSLLQLYTNAQAVTCDINLNVETVDATCMNNGEVRVAIEGADYASIDIETAEYMIESVTPGGFSTSFAHWENGIYSFVPPGEYNITMRAFCSKAGYIEVFSDSQVRVIDGSYIPLVSSAGIRRKTLNCMVSGEVTVNHAQGTPPYTLTFIEKPVEYVDKTVFTDITGSSTILENIAMGAYKMVVSDICGYKDTLTITMPAVSDDIYRSFAGSALYANTFSISPNCNHVRFATYSPSSTHELYYYYNKSDTINKYYEAAIVLNDQGSKDWQPLSAVISQGVIMPYDYHQMRVNGDYFVIYMRVKDGLSGCSDYSIRTGTMGYPSVSTLTTQNTCDSAIVSFAMWNGTGGADRACYPAEWKITTVEDENTILQQGILNNGNQITPQGKLAQGSGFILTVTDASGEIVTREFQTDISGGQVFTNTNGYPNGGYNSSSNNYNYPNIFGKTYMRIQIKGTEDAYNYTGPFIEPGTKIEYISAPPGAPDSKFGPVGSEYIITSHNSQYFYLFGPGTSHNQASSYVYESNFEQMIPGYYVFKVTNACGAEQIFTFTQNSIYGFTELTYTEEYACEGLRVFPSGFITLTDINGITEKKSTYYRILSATPDDIVFDYNVIDTVSGKSLLLPTSGKYIISMSGVNSSNNNYSATTVTIEYEKDRVILDANHTSSYVCRDGLSSFISVRAMNGVAPYTYNIDGTDLTNQTGKFEYGDPGELVAINVTDACEMSSFNFSVTMIDLSTIAIVYTNTAIVCEKGTIEVNCVTLGETEYQWRGPAGFTSNEQYPRIPDVTPDMEGYYVVEVIPEGCRDVIKDSVYIRVVANPQLPTVTTPEVDLCYEVSYPFSLIEASGTTADSNNTLIWYDTPAGNETVIPPSFLSTSVLGDTYYYVSQLDNSTTCESNRVEIKVGVQVCEFTLRGTVFPFVKTNNNEFDNLFEVTAALYSVPHIEVEDPIDVIFNDQALYSSKAIYYDGSIFVAGTPKNPGDISLTNNPGEPINWALLGKTVDEIDDTLLTEEDNNPTNPIGVYTFENVSPGEYILVLSRPGYLTRFTKISVYSDGVLGHRELLLGDVDDNLIVNSYDLSKVNSKSSLFPGVNYESKYDMNANGEINPQDISLLLFYLGSHIELYIDTAIWLSEY